MSPLILIAAIFLGVTTLVAALGFLLRDKHETKELTNRLDTFTYQRAAEAEVTELLRKPIETPETEKNPGLLDRLSSPSTYIQRLITQADFSFSVAQFMMMSVGLALFGGTIAFVLRLPVLLLLASTSLGLLPFMVLIMRRRKRLKKFANQLPDALELIARALRAGHSLASGFQLVSQEMPPPIATEFQRTYDEQNFGVPLEDALRNLGQRVPNIDLGFFVTAVAIQRQTGGDLAEILDKLGYVIRERFKLFGQVQALTAEGRLSGYILNALPIIVLVALIKLNPNYVMLLFRDPLGIKMLAIAGFMQILGAIAIHKIVNIRV
jgi:tight adherence protein B